MAGRIKESRNQTLRGDFRHSHALVVGINDYANGIRPLTTPVNDATRLANLLAHQHGYHAHLLVEDVTKPRLEEILTRELARRVSEEDRLLFYFAGHGIALDDDDGPQGYLVLQDAEATDRESLLPMTDLHAWLDALRCRHMLAILDCCFAGAFRWASTRHLNVAGLETIHKERYERFVRSPAWQVLTSAAYDQEALDLVGGQALGARGARDEGGRQHSPFALALYDALRGEGDLIPREQGDGLITATELYLYLRERVEIEMGVAVRHDQTPGLWPLNRHDRGEYIFRSPNHALNLPPAPELTDELNPWRGLASYDRQHDALFFGREEEIAELAERVHVQPLTAVLGASGTGKSSLVKAGLLPHLDTHNQDEEGVWLVLPPLRPGRNPFQGLHDVLSTELSRQMSGTSPSSLRQRPHALADLVAAWREQNPGRNLLLVVDQLEELVTLAPEEERHAFLALLGHALAEQPEAFRLIVTLRSDFEPQFDAGTPLAPLWHPARYIVPPLDQADLRQIIEGPAAVRVLYFEPPELVDVLINEVLQTPGALPLLSFTLSEMYLHYLTSSRDNRALAQEDYDALGGVIGSLRNRANAEYDSLPDDAHRETMRRVMLRMISIEGGELARRRVYRSELVYPTGEENERVREVLNRLVVARLLVTGEDEEQATVEPAHDALILAWDRLLRWKQAAEEYLPLQRRLTQAAVEWTRAEADARAGFLWDDDPRLPQVEATLWPRRAPRDGLRGRLRQARQVMLPDTDVPPDTRWLNKWEVAFVRASLWARTRFWRRVVGVTTAVIIALTALAVFATIQANEATIARGNAEVESTRAVAAEGTAIFEASRAVAAEGTAVAEANRAVAAEEDAVAQANIAETRRAEAERQARIALAQSLAALAPRQANDVAGEDDELATLLALEAMRLSQENDGRMDEELDGALRPLVSQEYFSNILTDRQSAGSSVVFAPDGSLLAAAWHDGAVQLWDLADPRATPIPLEGLSEDASFVAFSADGEMIAAGGEGGSVKLWDVSNTATPTTAMEMSEVPILAGAFSPQRDMLAVGTGDGRFIVWSSVDTVSDLTTVETDGREVRSVAFSPNGDTLAAATYASRSSEDSGNSIYLWQVGDLSAEPVILPVGERWVQSVAFAPDGEALAVALLDFFPVSPLEMSNQPGEVWLWQLPAVDDPIILEQHPWAATSLAFSSDGDILALGSVNGTIRLLQPSDPDAESAVLHGHEGSVVAVNFAPDQAKMVSTSSDGAIRLWHMADPAAAPRVLDNHNGQVMSVAFAPAGNTVATASSLTRRFSAANPGNVRLWSVDDRTNGPRIMDKHQGPVFSVAFSPDGNTVASVSMVDPVWMWQPDDPASAPTTTLVFPEGYRTTPKSIAFSPDGTMVALLDFGGQILLWDLLDTPAEPAILESDTGEVNALAFASADQLVAGTADGAVLIWNVSDLTSTPVVLAETLDEITALVSTSNADKLAIGTAGGDVRIWDAATSDSTNSYLFEGHQGRVTAIAFSPNGETLATGGDDRIVRLWQLTDASTIRRPVSLAGHDGTIMSLTFSPPEGKLLVSGSSDGTALLWDVSLDRLREIGCELTRRNLTWSEWESFLPIEDEYRCTCANIPPHPSVLAADASLVADSCPLLVDDT